MITLTPKAIEQVKSFMAAQEEPFNGIRLSVVAGGCSGFEYRMKLEKDAGESDQVITQDGIDVFVDHHSLLYLEDTEIDFVETVQGSGFAFNNPNSHGTCGCGESFRA